MFFCCGVGLALLLLEGFQPLHELTLSVGTLQREDCQGEYFRQHIHSPVGPDTGYADRCGGVWRYRNEWHIPSSICQFFHDEQLSLALVFGLCCRFQMRLYMPFNEKLAELADGGRGQLFAAFGVWIAAIVHKGEDFDHFEESEKSFYLMEIIR